ncbi:hypothetical protein J4417_00305 [Candidatus Woesearchaeota archaeon]|nr:hypothetical protein [Candidatus Woesearchaeota archaeon]
MKKKQRSSLANNPKNWSIEAAKLVYTGTLIFLGIAVGVFNLFLQNVIIKNIMVFTILMTLLILFGVASLILSFMGIKKDDEKLINWSFYLSLAMIFCIIILYFTLMNAKMNSVLPIG